jgi:nucleoside-diphosphate-sugar epimerase
VHCTQEANSVAPAFCVVLCRSPNEPGWRPARRYARIEPQAPEIWSGQLKFTVFGGRGFIGRALCDHLRQVGHEVYVPPRDTAEMPRTSLGHVVYSIGLTSDFRTRPFDGVDAHVSLLNGLLRESEFDSFLYLSSTRVYAGLDAEEAREDAILSVRPDLDGLFNLSKLTGEAICLCYPSPKIRVARVSNVYGADQNSDIFLGMLLDELARDNAVVIHEAPTSSKDYVALEDVCWLLERIALYGTHRIYNVACGAPFCHGDIAAELQLQFPGATIEFATNARQRSFPRISNARVTEEFGFHPRSFRDFLRTLRKTVCRNLT